MPPYKWASKEQQEISIAPSWVDYLVNNTEMAIEVVRRHTRSYR